MVFQQTKWTSAEVVGQILFLIINKNNFEIKAMSVFNKHLKKILLNINLVRSITLRQVMPCRKTAFLRTDGTVLKSSR